MTYGRSPAMMALPLLRKDQARTRRIINGTATEKDIVERKADLAATMEMIIAEEDPRNGFQDPWTSLRGAPFAPQKGGNMKPGDIGRELDLSLGRLDGVKKMVTDAHEPNKMEMLTQHEAKVKQIAALSKTILDWIEGYKATRNPNQ